MELNVIHVCVSLVTIILICSQDVRAQVNPVDCLTWRQVFPDCPCFAATDKDGNLIPRPVVDCSSKNLDSVPPKQADTSITLYEFRLNNNRLTTLVNDAFQGIKIRHLDLTGNSLGDLSDNAFRNTEDTLTILHIEGNSTGAPQKNALRKLINLEELTMKNYKVVHLDGEAEQAYFQAYSDLQKLTLDNWGIESIDPHSFIAANNHHSLRSLALLNQNLNSLPVDVLREPELRNLDTLQISHTQIEEVTADAFLVLNQIKEINLSHNVIKRINQGSFNGVGDTLEILNLGHNILGSIEIDDLQYLTDLVNLRQIILEQNELLSVPKMMNLGTGQPLNINLRANKISSLLNDELVSYRERLEEFDVSLNQIENIANQFFNGATNLKSLIVSNQGGSSSDPLSIPNSLTQAANSLTYLDLSGQDLDSTNLWQIIGQLVKVETLILHSAHINAIPDLAFEHLTSLTELDLRHNSISQLTDRSMIGPRHLKKLLLRANSITKIPSCFFHQNTNDQIILDLGSNPIICSTDDCDVKKFLEDYRNGFYTFPDSDSLPKCSDNQPLTQKDPTQFSCDQQQQCIDYYTTQSPTDPQPTTDPTNPTPTITLQVSELETTSMKVSWDISETSELRYFRVKVSSSTTSKNFEEDNLPVNTRQSNVQGLQPNTAYSICVFAYLTSTAPVSKCDLQRTKPEATSDPLSGDDSSDSASVGIIVGCVAGAVVLLVILAVIIYLLVIRRRPKKTEGPTGMMAPVQPRQFTKAELPSMNGDSRSFVKVKKNGAPDSKHEGMQVVAISDGQTRPSGGRVGRAQLLSSDGTYEPMDKSIKKPKDEMDYEPMKKPYNPKKGNVNEAYENIEDENRSLPPTPGPVSPQGTHGYYNEAFAQDSSKYDEVII